MVEQDRSTEVLTACSGYLTGGNPTLVPMVQTTSAVRRSTGQAISSSTALRRRQYPRWKRS